MGSAFDARSSSPQCKNESSCELDVNHGLPPLVLGSQPASFFEFWPAWFFYLPIVLYWIYLSTRYRSFGLPMVVNPSISLGGMVGESKFEILKQGGDIAHQYILPYFDGMLDMADESSQKSDELLSQYADNEIKRALSLGIELPFIIKPELGCRGAGVRIVRSRDEMVKYLQHFPEQRRYLIQKLAPYSAEAGVFYERVPGQERGAVTSITLKYRPFVIGDGVNCLKALILKDARASLLRRLYLKKNAQRLSWIPDKNEQVALGFAGSHCRGSIFRDGNEFITPELSEKIDEIMCDFPEFHYGRLDVKFRDMQSLTQGEDFVIIEVNGVSSEKTHIWDSRTSIWDVFSTLCEQYGTLFRMGNLMRRRGFTVPSVKVLIKTWIRELKQAKAYPSTE